MNILFFVAKTLPTSEKSLECAMNIPDWLNILHFWGLILLIVLACLHFLRYKNIAAELNRMQRKSIDESDEINEEKGFSVEILPELLRGKVEEKQSINLKHNSSLQDLFSNDHVVFVVGDDGSGKTTILHYLADCLLKSGKCMRDLRKHLKVSHLAVQLINASQLNDQNLSQKHRILDILWDSAKCKKKHVQKWVNYVLTWKYFGVINEDNHDWSHFWSKYKKRLWKRRYPFGLLVLIDDYDKIDDEKRSDVQSELESIADAASNVWVVISSRYDPYSDKFSRLGVCKLTESQIKNYAKKQDATLKSIPKKYQFLLDSPNLLSMGSKIDNMPNSVCTTSRNEIPLVHQQINSVSDIYWNYLCSILGNAVGCSNGLVDNSTKAIYALYVLPYVAMRLEAENWTTFTLDNFQSFVNDFLKNVELFQCVKHRGPNKLWENANAWKQLQDIYENETSLNLFKQNGWFLREAENNSGHKDVHYRFHHELLRDFFAAVYRYQRDMATLDESETRKRYNYSDCELHPDISVRVRKFYYELIAHDFRNMTEEVHKKFSDNSVRYNSLLSDLYFYGDAADSTAENDSLHYSKDTVKSLAMAQKAIHIGEKRLNDKYGDYVGMDPDKDNLVTDLALLCWIRWSATDIIMKSKKSEDLRIMSYHYSKKNSECGKYGDFLGCDKLAQMLYTDNYLPDDLIDIELEGQEGSDEEDKLEKKVDCYLNVGKGHGYHYSFNKHALFHEKKVKDMNPETEEFREKIQDICDLFYKSCKFRKTDFYAFSRLLFYYMCYGVEARNSEKSLKLPKSVERSCERMASMEAMGAPNEIHGYINFCENVGFWYLIQMFSEKGTYILLTDFLDKLQHTNPDDMRSSLNKGYAKKAIRFFEKLYHASLNNNKQKLKAAIACQFVMCLLPYEDWYSDLPRELVENLSGTGINFDCGFFKEERYKHLLEYAKKSNESEAD